MDLISRKAAIEAIDHEREMLINQGRNGAEHVIVHHARRLIEDMPSVPAVPLDKLCEWLEVHARAPIYNMQHTAEWWNEELKMWMEEQDAAD